MLEGRWWDSSPLSVIPPIIRLLGRLLLSLILPLNTPFYRVNHSPNQSAFKQNAADFANRGTKFYYNVFYSLLQLIPPCFSDLLSKLYGQICSAKLHQDAESGARLRRLLHSIHDTGRGAGRAFQQLYWFSILSCSCKLATLNQTTDPPTHPANKRFSRAPTETLCREGGRESACEIFYSVPLYQDNVINTQQPIIIIIIINKTLIVYNTGSS